MNNKKPHFRQFLFLLCCALAFAIPLSIEWEIHKGKLNILTPTEPVLGLISLLTPIYILIHKKLRKLQFIDFIVIGFFIGTSISSLFSVYLMASVKYAITVFWYLNAGYLTMRFLEFTKKELQTIAFFYLSGSLLLASYALFNFYIYGGIFYEISYKVSFPFIPQGHTNLSSALEPALLICLGFIAFATSKKQLLSYTLIGIIIYCAIDFSWSRASIVSTFFIFTTYIVFIPKMNRKVSYISLAIIILFPISVHFTHDYIHENFRRDKSHYNIDDVTTMKANKIGSTISLTDISNDVSNKERITRWKTGIIMFTEDPITGIGPGTFSDYYLEYQKNHQVEGLTVFSDIKKNIHNLYIGWLTEGGLAVFIPGVLLILFIVVQGIKRITFKQKKLFFRSSQPVYVGMLLIYFMSFVIHGVFQDFNNEAHNIIPFWSAIGLFSVFLLKEKESTSSEIPEETS